LLRARCCGRDDLYGRFSRDNLEQALAPFIVDADQRAMGHGRVLFLKGAEPEPDPIGPHLEASLA
jgi:hypothetical protein